MAEYTRVVPWAIGQHYRRREAPLSAMTVFNLPPYMWPKAEQPGPNAIHFNPPKPWRDVKDCMLPLEPILLFGLDRVEYLDVGHLFSLEELEDIPVRYIDYRYIPNIRGYAYIVKLCWWVDWEESHRWKKKIQTIQRYAGMEEYIKSRPDNVSDLRQQQINYSNILEWALPFRGLAHNTGIILDRWNGGVGRDTYGPWLLRFYRLMAENAMWTKRYSKKNVDSSI